MYDLHCWEYGVLQKSLCDADYAGDRIERKSTSGNCQFLGEKLISCASKRQTTIAMSTAEAEYISTASCCTQLLWMKHQLEDIFTKPLTVERFDFIKKNLNMHFVSN